MNKSEAARLVSPKAMTFDETSGRLALPKATLANWGGIAEREEGFEVAGGRTVNELEAEVSRLRKELDNVNWKKKS